MRSKLTHALACTAGILGTLGVQFLLVQGAPRPAEGPRRIDLSIEDGRAYRVRRAVDGDTIVLENGLHVRYQGVNTPESGRWVEDPAPLSATAAARNKDLVEGGFVRLRLANEPMDKYGRVVARVTKVLSADSAEPESDVEAQLLREGLARVFGLGLRTEDREALKKEEDAARAAGSGIWGLKRAEAGNGHQAAAQPFCASSGGEVYHRSECAQAKRISAAHYQGYASEEAARATGRRPCSQCLKAAP